MGEEARLDTAWLKANPLPDHHDNVDKNGRGRVLIIGGCRRVPGGMLLTAEAAFRAGAGKVTIATIASAAIPIGIAFPSCAVVALPETESGEISPESADLLLAELKLHDWVSFEADVHGSDSIAHIVMNQVMIKYRNPRVAPRNNPNQVEKYLKEGLLGWQSEGVPVQYRNIEIKLYPEDPLYATLYPTGLKAATIQGKRRESPVLDFHDGILRVRPTDLNGGLMNIQGQELQLSPGSDPR